MILAHQKLILLMAFVAVFMAFAKLKSGYYLYGTKPVKLMKYGCTLLIFGAAVGLIGSMDIFHPGYTKSMAFFVLESIVGYIGGWVLIIWGMSGWLPYLFSVSSRLQKKTKSLNLYEAVSQLALYGDASTVTFKRIAGKLLENFGYQAASLHISGKSRQLALFASVGLTKKSRETINIVQGSLYNKVFDTGEVFQADESLHLNKNLVVETETGAVVEALALPVNFGTNKIGVMTIYTDHSRVFSRDELGVLDAVCTNLALAFYKDSLIKSINSEKSFRDFIAVILKTSRSEDNFNTRVIRLARLLKQYLKFNTLHIYIISNGAPQILDFNLPPASKVLIERGFGGGNGHEPVDWVIAKKRSLILPEETARLGKAVEMPKNAHTLYAPIIIEGEPVGVLGLAVPVNHQFTQNDLTCSNAIASAISGAMLQEINSELANEAFDRIGAIKYSLETAITGKPSGMIYKELAKIMVEKTPATFCRIMLLSPERDKFRTTAIYQRRELAWDEKSMVALSLDELYAHRKVITTGKPVIVTDLDSKRKISELENKLLLPKGISQCMITPIIIDGKTRGVVTIGESRKAERAQVNTHKIVFALLLTNIVSMLLMQKEQAGRRKSLIESNRLVTRRLVNLQNRAGTFRLVDGFSSKINGPLAGILASCEYLKSKPEAGKEEIDRYLNVINKNASKIHELSGQFAEARRTVESLVEI